MKTPFLIANRIYLRPIEREDAPMIAAWINDPEVRTFVRRNRPMNVASEIEFIDRINADETMVALVITLKDGDRAIGVTGLHAIDSRNRSAEFGISIGDKPNWGQGYGKEVTQAMVDHAFGTLNMNRLALFIYDFNERAIRCYEKVGFRREGVLREEHYRDGRYCNTLVMSVLRSEWDERRGAT